MYPFEDEGPGDTLWELGLDFTVTRGKTGFRGAEEHERLKGRERFKIFGVLIEGEAAASEGDSLTFEGSEVGVITCAMYSRLTNRSMAIARVAPAVAVQGTPLTVSGSIEASAISHALPFDDPAKSKRTAKD
jgi:aminomethyltransferase